MDNLFKLDGTHAVVIGGGAGIGQAVAVGLGAHGAHVTVLDRDEEAAEATAEGLRASGAGGAH
ncbi:MAG: SDR family NAD(P)-dependent oxidoreductase, partial [Gemmatimonadota bacterium]|nr:SDR family NAD(P)-dependent oxidoreductase [Gemmatimonadota bacterium]